MKNSLIHPTADVSKKARVGANAKIWHGCHVRENASIGANCVLGKGVYIDHDVRVGTNVKIQNNCSIYFGARIEDGVFIGPHACLTNDKSPRAITGDNGLKLSGDWEHGRITVKKGASIGAGSIILPNTTIGKFAMIGAGSVVTKDVGDYVLAYGNPAEPKGYVCACGAKIKKLQKKGSRLSLICPKCGQKTALTKK